MRNYQRRETRPITDGEGRALIWALILAALFLIFI